jgi:hypothetical protein
MKMIDLSGLTGLQKVGNVPKLTNNCSTTNGCYGAIAASDLVSDQ